jgi:hypothetical protein
MKTYVAFIVGAVVAAGMVYIMMRPDRPAEPVTQPTTTVTVPQSVEPVAEPEVKPEPVAAPPEPVATPPRAQAQRPAARREVPARKAARPAREDKPQAQPLPQQQTPPVTVAQSTPPPQQPVIGAAPPPAAVQPPPVVEEKKPVRVPQTVTIPAGTLLTVRVDQTLSTQTVQTGEAFRASLDQPLVIDGFVIAERGARVEGRVVESDPGGRTRGTARLSLELVRLNSSDGQRLRLQTESFSKQAEKETKRDVAKIGAAAGIGAAIGAIAGGGKGAAIGAAVGGAAGTGGVMATRGGPAEIPAETRMTFRLRDPITVTEKLN